MPKQFTLNNDQFIKFKFFEILNVKTVPLNSGKGYTEHVPKCDDILIRKINSLVSNQTFFTQGNSGGSASHTS